MHLNEYICKGGKMLHNKIKVMNAKDINGDCLKISNELIRIDLNNIPKTIQSLDILLYQDQNLPFTYSIKLGKSESFTQLCYLAKKERNIKQNSAIGVSLSNMSIAYEIKKEEDIKKTMVTYYQDQNGKYIITSIIHECDIVLNNLEELKQYLLLISSPIEENVKYASSLVRQQKNNI